MFSLDHERLRSGGQAILDAGDEAGQVLFTSVAGIEGLRATQQKLADEANGLWGKRQAAGRTYYQAKDRLEEADQALREHTVTTAKWQELKQTFEDARAENDDLEQRIQARDAEQRKLGRIRRVHQDVRRYVQLQATSARWPTRYRSRKMRSVPCNRPRRKTRVRGRALKR